MSEATIGRLAAILALPLLALMLALPHLFSMHGENVVCTSGEAMVHHIWETTVNVGVAVAIIADLVYLLTVRGRAGAVATAAGGLTLIANFVFAIVVGSNCS